MCEVSGIFFPLKENNIFFPFFAGRFFDSYIPSAGFVGLNFSAANFSTLTTKRSIGNGTRWIKIEQETARQRTATIETFPRVKFGMEKKNHFHNLPRPSEKKRKRKNVNAKYLYKYAVFVTCRRIEWKGRKCFGTKEKKNALALWKIFFF